MSYLVLARKWRPKRFAELVGQEHVVRALTNALDTGRVHHAFLFTGTRGVGKTTIARIFAKSLNCEKGTSADPCGECGACRDIDAGRYIDLLEIDAASNTGVDDVREVIENAQYMPSRGKFKVYLIDEVHMLSKAAFNALLKTLEEPPEHVKFLLATTDPQKLPVTVLSRCLQFNLKRLDEPQIGGQITKILAAEGIEADEGAVRQIAHAADGSLRDGLSLLDQAIAYAGGALRDDGVRTMLGTVDRTQVGAMLDALAEGDGERLLQVIAALADFSPDWDGVLDALAEALHRVQVRQLVPGAATELEGIDANSFAERLRPEVVQLWYQMALSGRRDLPLAPSARAGFEMTVLRMLAFRPAASGEGKREAAPASAGSGRAAPASAASASASASTNTASAPQVGSAASAPQSASASVGAASSREPFAASHQTPARPATAAPANDHDSPPWPELEAAHQRQPIAPSQATAPPPAERAAPASTRTAPAPAAPAPAASLSASSSASAAEPAAVESSFSSDIGITNAEVWLHFASSNELKGATRQLVENAAFAGYSNGVLQLSLDSGFDYLRSDRAVRDLGEAIAQRYGVAPKITFLGAAQGSETLRQRSDRERGEQQVSAEQDFLQHPDVQRLMQQHGAKVVPDSIRPYEE